MKETSIDQAYWEQRWLNGSTGWDVGAPTPPLKDYIDQLTDKSVRILIPGCGNAYEADYLLSKGFTSVTLLDIAKPAVEQLQQRYAGNACIRVLHEDFFQHQQSYDLILEQTFFCALDPALRTDYVEHMHRLLHSGGTLAGVLFGREFTDPGPPFGGSKEAYEKLFSAFFTIHTLAPCYNSIGPRAGTEIFVIAKS
jgi:SAM-dependent methyltransferase